MTLEGTSGEILAEFIVCEVPGKDIQWRLTLNEFREVEYLHLRKYYLSFDEGYVPSRDGACFPATLDNVARLLDALLSLLTTEESIEVLLQHIKNKRISELANEVVVGEQDRTG